MDRERVGPALRTLLHERGTPQARTDLAVRAVDDLMLRALSMNPDGSAFVITGDIPAMWLRDSTAQVKPLLALTGVVPEVAEIARAVLRTQVEQILIDPRANAFNPSATGAAMRRDFPDQSAWVFERKYALDSLCAPLTLAWEIHRATGSFEHVDARFCEAARAIVSLCRKEQNHRVGDYAFRRRFSRAQNSLPVKGQGHPVGRTGMVWSGFRPSDDACRLGYHVPANAMLAVCLKHLATLVTGTPSASLGLEALALAADVRDGISRHGIIDDAELGPVYAYEVDGLGQAVRIDDANVPSLLSLPYLGFCEVDAPLYAATRRWVLSERNSCWARGTAARGVGSPHTRRGWVWPLAIAVEGLTTASADERVEALERLEATIVDDGLLHESIDPSNPRRFSRPWFSWADMLYVELVLAVHASA